MSPYNMEGGDTQEKDKWMEGCVSKVEGTKDKNGKVIDKSSAIAICKFSYKKSHGDKAKANFIIEQIFQLPPEKD